MSIQVHYIEGRATQADPDVQQRLSDLMAGLGHLPGFLGADLLSSPRPAGTGAAGEPLGRGRARAGRSGGLQNVGLHGDRELDAADPGVKACGVWEKPELQDQLTESGMSRPCLQATCHEPPSA